MLGKQLVPARRAARLGNELPGFRGRLHVAWRYEAHHDQHSRQQLLRFDNFCRNQILRGELAERDFETRVEAEVAGQLEHMDRELEVDEPARPVLHVERALRRLVALHFRPHRGRVVHRLAGIARRFGATTALAGADLEVRAGEVHGVLGENGAGKSTLLGVLGGMQRPDAGRVEVRAMAHVTGGGWEGNVPRTLPAGLGAEIDTGSWPVPRIFSLVQERGDVADEEMVRTFNLGVGMTAVVPASLVEPALAAVPDACRIGRVIEACTSATMFAEGVSVVIIQAAPTICTWPPKFEARLAIQIARKVGMPSGARAEARGLDVCSSFTRLAPRVAIMPKRPESTTSRVRLVRKRSTP